MELLAPEVVVGDGAAACACDREALHEPSRLHGCFVLVIDDHVDSLEITELALLREGARVHAASSAEVGLRLFDAYPIDVIVCDLSMPSQDGFELIERVRARADGKRDTPALAFSAYANKTVIQRALDAGFDAHAAKPMMIDALVAQIAQLAKR